MRQSAIRGRRWAIALTASLCLLAVPAVAGDRPWEQERWDTIDAGFDSGEDEPSTSQPWLELQPRKDEQHEFEYDDSLSLNLEENFIFSIQSPFAGEWAPGFAFELRF
jgi:hypothetical protein